MVNHRPHQKALHVLLCCRYFPPEIGTAASLFFELAEELVRQGHDVTVLTGFPWYNLGDTPERYRSGVFRREKVNNIEIIRLRVSCPGTKKFRLFIGHFFSPLSIFIGSFFVRRFDIIYGYSPPLLVGLAGIAISTLRRKPFVLGLQDLHPQAYIDQGILTNKIAINILRKIEAFIYRRSSAVTVHSDGNRNYVHEVLGTALLSKISVVENWVNMGVLEPRDKNSKILAQAGLEDCFVVGYAGTLGLSQGSSILIEAANRLRKFERVRFFIVGDGVEKAQLIDKAKEYGLANIVFWDMQPVESYPEIVSVFDAGIVTLNSKVKTPVVPSKIISLMALGKPIVVNAPLNSECARVVRESRAGLLSGAGDVEEFTNSVLELYRTPELLEQLGDNGARFARERFGIEQNSRKIEKIFLRSLGESGQGRVIR